ncbi:outer membrane lipoprotein LolB [Massilia sp. MB5]|uniref:outer membrane lipoprotein LolB n=1 Tax=Massilia sp. MB5 TaxID=2919578 RepID=UPI001F107D30|nr:outer membrane lipoprotein LolB [Massilia sp. MB5]UMR32365.1 outer membrane lipoprotein LolB [Massilia sp. MB5]
MTVTRIGLCVIPAARAALAACAAAAILGLAGCASTPREPLSAAHVAPYSAALELQGRLSVNYTRDGSNQSLNGSFEWRQTTARTDITLSNPLGQTIAVIAVTPEAATLSDGKNPPRTAPNIDQLSREALGWPLPVAGLRDWLQGHAIGADGKPFAASPAVNTVKTRDGWQLSYVTWQEGSMPPKPLRIDAERRTGEAIDDISIRIVIRPE